MLIELQRYYIAKYELENKPLLIAQIGTYEIQLYRQIRTGWLSCITFDKNNVEASAGLHDGSYGSIRIHDQHIIYGFLPEAAVSIAVSSDKQKVRTTSTFVDSGLFLLSVPTLQTIIVSFQDSNHKIVRELEIPVRPPWPKKNLRTRLKHLLYNLGLLPIPESTTIFLSK